MRIVKVCPREHSSARGAKAAALERALDRYRHRLEGAVAIDQIDALLHDAEAVAVAAQAVLLASGEDALLVVAVFNHHHGRADGVFALPGIGVLDDDAADQMRGAR